MFTDAETAQVSLISHSSFAIPHHHPQTQTVVLGAPPPPGGGGVVSSAGWQKIDLNVGP